MLKSYRSRLFIAFTLVWLVSVALFLGLTVSQLIDYYRHTQAGELHLKLKLWTYSLDFTDDPRLSPRTQEALHRGSAELGAALVVVYGDERPRFYATDGYALSAAEIAAVKDILDRELPYRRAVTVQREGLVIVALPAAPDDQTPTLLAAVAPAASLEVGWRQLARPLLYAGLVGLAVSLLLTLLLARAITRPVTRLTTAADRMAQGVYDDPPLPAGDDELGRLACAFNTMRDQVRQAQQSQRDFLAGISHDLKTPLAIVQGYAGALADGTAADEPTRGRALVGIQRETERMTRLVVTLLELARLEAGLVPLELIAFDLVELARGVLADLAPQAHRQGLCLVDDLPPALPAIAADPTQMERVLVNLLENALRFTPTGGTVTVGGAVEPAGAVSLWVQDTGPGIPAAALPHVFDRFYQADQSRPGGRHGSGLGLTIAQEIVSRHGGRIKADSEIGRGARFTVTLPMAQSRPR
ncbi:MAG: HAMP domain-containing histidine kinase [Chloroflexi bacterium]|nr:HAMP domain-containing histidine kinase [Chloroflexota bacterium]